MNTFEGLFKVLSKKKLMNIKFSFLKYLPNENLFA